MEVGTNNYISLPRWYVLGEDGTAVIRDWQLNGEIIRKTGMTEETVVPVKTAAGLTKTMAPRREDTIVKEDLPKVSGDIADFHRNVVAVIRDGAEPEIKLFQVMRVMKLMEAIFRSAETNQVIEFQDYIQYNNRLHGNCALFAQFHYLRKKRCDCLLKNRSETAVAKG